LINQNYGDVPFHEVEKPSRTIVGGGTHAGVAAVHVGRDFGESVGHPVDSPSLERSRAEAADMHRSSRHFFASIAMAPRFIRSSIPMDW
jgi:hypothetical protein